MFDPIRLPLPDIAEKFASGEIIPFLGAGANRYDAPKDDDSWRGKCLPYGYELSRYFAARYNVTGDDANNLMRTSFVTEDALTRIDLQKKLTEIFDAPYDALSIHTFLAELPEKLRKKGYPSRPMVMISTNYDCLLEDEFERKGIKYNLLCYRDDSNENGASRFDFYAPNAVEPEEIYSNNELNVDINNDQHLIMKIHGSIRHNHPEKNSFVITEDDYIRYVAKDGIAKIIPSTIKERLKSSSFLFFGYGLRDWNLQALLFHLWSLRTKDEKYRSWSVQGKVYPLEEKLWERRLVYVNEVPLDEFVDKLNTAIDNLPEYRGKQ